MLWLNGIFGVRRHRFIYRSDILVLALVVRKSVHDDVALWTIIMYGGIDGIAEVPKTWNMVLMTLKIWRIRR